MSQELLRAPGPTPEALDVRAQKAAYVCGIAVDKKRAGEHVSFEGME